MNITRIQSRIEAVTVYREGALVRRIAEIVRTNVGFPEFACVTGLPLSVQDASVRVRVQPADESDTETRVLPVASDVRVALDVPDNDESLPPPVDDELKAARLELHRLNGRINQAKRELGRVERMVVAARPRFEREQTAPPPASPTRSRVALLALRESYERTLRHNLTELERRLYEAELHAKRLQARHERATSARQASEHELRKALIIALHDDHQAGAGTSAARAHLVVEYLIPGACWSPAYTVHLSPQGDAEFAMRAVVAQHSGEDWGAVQLTLSTADAHSWTELPELSSLRIGRRQALSPKTGWRPPPSGVDDLFRDYDRGLRKRAMGRDGGRASEFDRWEQDTRELAAMSEQTTGVYPAVASGAFDRMDSPDLLDDMEEPTVPNLRPPGSPPVPAQSARPMMPMRAAPAPNFGGPPPARSAPEPEMSRSRRTSGMPKKRKAGHRNETAPLGGAMADSPDMDDSMLFAGGGPPGAAMMSDLGGRGGGGGYGGVGYAGEEDITILNASADLLSYADLRMPAASADGRGRLKKAHQRDIYMELLMEQRIEVTFNVLAVIASATHRASAVGSQPLPSGHRPAGSDRYDYAYRADTPVDVPSDGAFHSIALTQKSADTNLSYVVVPRETTDVFRVAELGNPLAAPILDGPADIYLGKDFLLTSDVGFTPPGGKVRLGLGVEQAIKVSRNTSYREETSGLLRGSLLLWHKIDIELQNHLEQLVTCEVRERIPSTRKGEDDIEVKVENANPTWETYKPKAADSPEVSLEGGYQWIVQVPGKGGKRSLTAAYTIKIPSKYELAGGNRREV